MRTKEDVFKTAYARLRMKGEVTGTGDIDRIRRGYQWRRKNWRPVTYALWSALTQDTMPRWAEASIGEPDSNGYRHLTKPDAYGLRFVDYADKISSSVNHEGWYTSEEGRQGEVYRGVVFQLPGRGCMQRLVAGYHDMESDYYVVDFSCVYEAAPRDHPDKQDDVPDLAASDADSMAEDDAERERDYDRQWQKANEWQELKAELEAIDCTCESASDERDRLQGEIKEIEEEFLDIAEFARNNL